MKEYGAAAWPREYDVADEAIGIAIKCWEHCSAASDGDSLTEMLRETIVQHICGPLRGLPPLAATREPSGRKAQPTPKTPVEFTADHRAILLAEYKAATGNPSNKKIYEARNSGIYKPEFYQWLRGSLPANSITTKKFEGFLTAKKRPIPRKPTT